MSRDLRWLLPLVYMAGLFALSSISGTTMESTPGLQAITPDWQNLLHIPVFGGLALAWLWALEPRLAVRRARIYAAFALTLVYAVVDESWQSTIPGRFGSLTDLGLDALGAGFALWLLAPRLAKEP